MGFRYDNGNLMVFYEMQNNTIITMVTEDVSQVRVYHMTFYLKAHLYEEGILEGMMSNLI